MARKFKFVSKKKKKINFFECPEEVIDTNIVKGAHIELFSDREMILDGCCGVFEYREDYIKLNLGKGTLILCGRDFDIISFEGRVINIRGRINSLEFCV